MLPIALYLLKMSLCSGVLYGYYHLALRNRVFHQYNRFYLLAAVLFSLLFPLIPLPYFYQSARQADAIQLYRTLLFSSSESTVAADAAGSWSWQAAVGVLYVAVCFLLTGRLVVGLLHLYKLVHTSDVTKMGSIRFVVTRHPAAPFSFFNWLFWKKSIDLESKGGQTVFRHELVHIQEKHTLDKLLLQAVLALFWINPFFWFIRRELQMIHEFIADKKATAGVGTEALAAMILQAVYGSNYSALINPFFQQSIKRRLAMLQKTFSQPQNAYLGRVLALPLCCLLLFAFAKKEEKPVFKLVEPVTETTASVFTTFDTIPTENIKEVRVDKKDSVNTITVIYKDGKNATFTEKQAKEKGILMPPPPPPVPYMALYVIDGKEMGTKKENKNLDKIDPDNIESINVLKGEHATKKYGAKGKNGVIEITTKKTATKTFRVTSKNGATEMKANEIAVDQNKNDTSFNTALLVIDGQDQGPVGTGKKLNAINPQDIESINVLKDEHATQKYGEKGKYGAIEIITKKENQKSGTSGKSSLTPRQDANITFVEVEQPPVFPGGKAAWQAFLGKNLKPSIPVDNGAPAGTYNVEVQFKVARDGTISEIQPATALGYGMENAVVALMQKSPKWVPAEQNGYKVTALHKQKVTFVISEEK